MFQILKSIATEVKYQNNDVDVVILCFGPWLHPPTPSPNQEVSSVSTSRLPVNAKLQLRMSDLDSQICRDKVKTKTWIRIGDAFER